MKYLHKKYTHLTNGPSKFIFTFIFGSRKNITKHHYGLCSDYSLHFNQEMLTVGTLETTTNEEHIGKLSTTEHCKLSEHYKETASSWIIAHSYE